MAQVLSEDLMVAGRQVGKTENLIRWHIVDSLRTSGRCAAEVQDICEAMDAAERGISWPVHDAPCAEPSEAWRSAIGAYLAAPNVPEDLQAMIVPVLRAWLKQTTR